MLTENVLNQIKLRDINEFPYELQTKIERSKLIESLLEWLFPSDWGFLRVERS